MRKYFKYIIPSIITFIILSVIFYTNGLYPYGINSIVQVDADYQYIPVLYRIYNFLHGIGNIIYDDIGLGNNIYISMVIQGSIFSPVNLLLYFTSRDNIINYFNIILIIKICLISLTIYIYIDNKFKIDNFYKILGSLLYTFSGFILFNYFNIMWLDCVILFPLIIMYLDKLINDDKYSGYIITLGLSLIISYYISYFILIFIIFYTFIYINLYMDKSHSKKIIWRLGISTLISFLIASFSILPCIYQMFISSRFSSLSNYSLMSETMLKSLYVLVSPLLMILFILLIGKYKYDKKNIYFYLILLGLFIMGIFIEPVNLSIHGGSYWDFPYRYGFITSFILLNGGLYYIEKFSINGSNKYLWLKIILFLIGTIFLIYISKLYLKDIINERIFLDFDNKDTYIKILIIILLIVIINIISLSIGNRYIREGCLLFINIGSIFIFSYMVMFYNEGYYLSKEMNDINNNMMVFKDYRYKIDYKSYTPDYGFILDVNSLDNWIHLIPNNEMKIYRNLGYKVSGTCIYGYGGTIFSDWLFNIRYIISNKVKDNDIYELIDKYDNKYLYRYRYSDNFGITYNEILDNYDTSGFELQNMIYKNLFNSDKDIIKIDKYSLSENDIYINYSVNDKGILYIKTDDYDKINYISINENYITDIEDYIIDLGVYDKDIVIHINTSDNEIVNFDLGYIKIDDINKLNSNVNYVDGNYYINDVNSKNLFLPINNIDGIKVYVNDALVNSDKYLDNFISVKINDGDNKIKIKYDMPLFKIGIILSILGIILFIIIIFRDIKMGKLISNICYYVYLIFTILLFIYYYICSMIKYLK